MKYFSLILLILIPLSAFSQGSKNYNYNEFRTKPYYFGITLGLNYNEFKVNNSREFIQSTEFNSVSSYSKPGLVVGLIGNLKIGQYFDFRTVPSFSIINRTLTYTLENETEQDIRLESVLFELPVLFRYKSAPYKDKRFFVLGGMKYSYDFNSNARVRESENLINISPHDFQVELGAGIQFFMPYFIFSPQIKFSHGLGNILIYNDQLQESRLIEKIYSRGFSITLNFEG